LTEPRRVLQFSLIGAPGLSHGLKGELSGAFSEVVDIRRELALVRKYTGDRFSAARGYDLRKPMSAARVRTIHRYFTMIEELTSRPHKIFVPPKGTRKEIFEFTGQKTHPRFKKAIVVLPDATQTYRWEIDKSRPKGSRFTLVNKRTKERMWHIPAEMFDQEYSQAYDENIWDEEELSPEFFADVLEEYAVEDAVYMIESGDYHMWGSAGEIPHVAEKMAKLFKEYSHDRFDRYDKHSSWIGNWFRGVQVFGTRDALSYMAERGQADIERLYDRYGNSAPLMQFTHIRMLKSGDVAQFKHGELKASVPRSQIKGYDAKNRLHHAPKPRKKPKNARGRNR